MTFANRGKKNEYFKQEEQMAFKLFADLIIDELEMRLHDYKTDHELNTKFEKYEKTFTS